MHSSDQAIQGAPCGVCGSREASTFKRFGQWIIVRCRRCGVAYLSPRPSSDELRRLYTEQYYLDHELQEDHSSAVVEREIEARVPAARVLMKETPGACRWLDVGCASGYLLAAGRTLGAAVRGIEISRWAANFAIDALRLPVYCGTLKGFIGEEGASRFSLITAMAYLEHTAEPDWEVGAMVSLLDPAGVVVIRVPNVSSFDRHWHGSRWRGWSLPYHLHHFSPDVLRRMLVRHGLHVYRIDLGFWNPLVHVREARLGDGWRADHSLEGRPSLKDKAQHADGERARRSSAVKDSIKSILSQVFSGRDMIVYARR